MKIAEEIRRVLKNSKVQILDIESNIQLRFGSTKIPNFMKKNPKKKELSFT
jgi:hypothetical protein